MSKAGKQMLIAMEDLLAAVRRGEWHKRVTANGTIVLTPVVPRECVPSGTPIPPTVPKT